MPTVRGEFIRKLGCLCIHMQHLDRGLQTNDFCAIETESQVIQDLVLELIKSQRKLGREDQRCLRARFADRREEALRSLELSRRLLDDSHDAAISLVKAVQEAAGLDLEDSGPTLTDRRN